jgi:O-antigen/teichoic acid export membrane protein
MLRKIAITIASTGYAQVVAAAIFFITARFYGAEGRGSYAAATSLATFATAILGLSVGIAIPYFVVNAPGGREAFFRKSLSTVLITVGILSVIAALTTLVVLTIRPQLLGRVPASVVFVACLSMPYYTWIGSNDIIFSSAGAIVQQNRIAIINRTAFLLVSTIAILVWQISLVGYLVTYGAFNLLLMFQEIRFLARHFRTELRFEVSLATSLLRKGLQAHAVTIASLLNTSFSILALSYYSKDLIDVGYFNFASQLATLIMILPIVVNRYLMSEITARGPALVWPMQKRIMGFCLLAMALICVASFFLVVPFCRLLKPEFLGAVPLFRLFLLVILPSSFCTLMQSQWYSSGLFKVMSATNIAVGVGSVSITLFAVPRFHEYGAFATTLCTYLALFVINVIFYIRTERNAASTVRAMQGQGAGTLSP